MPIAIACPHCDWKGRVKDELAGKKGKCPTCGEHIPIPLKPELPPASAKSPVANELDVLDESDVVDERPPSKSRSNGSGMRRRLDNDDDDRPRRRRPADEEDDDRPPRSRRPSRDDEDEDRPRRRRPTEDEDDGDDRPSRARRRPSDDDEEDDRPSRTRRRPRDDDEDDCDDAPRARRGPRTKVKRKDTGGSGKTGAIVGGIILLALGAVLLGLSCLVGRINFWGIGLVVVGIISLGQALMRKD